MLPYFEIVQVHDAGFYQCRYGTNVGSELDSGFYIVVWTARARVYDYDGDAKFFGPFYTRTKAVTLLNRVMGDCFASSNNATH